MTLQQLRALCEAADRGLNFSRTAAALNTTQPAISRMIRSLEQEMGAELMVRSGTRILRLTPEGEEVVARARNVLLEVQNLSRIAEDRAQSRSGEMTVATTHTQAAYGLVGVVKQFTASYPDVNLQLRHGTSAEIAHWISKGEADIGISASPDAIPDNVVFVDAYPIERCIIAPAGHPILRVRKPSVKDIGRYPIIAYDERAHTGALLKELFAKERVQPKIVVKATDSDVVMSYVAAGIGIALLQTQIVQHEKRKGIRTVDIGHLLPPSMTKLALRRDAYLPGFMYEFIALVAPQWTRRAVEKLTNRGRERNR
jgi:DNA-binding transcriptional LysR family regulator